MKIHADWRYIEQEFGCALRTSFLMATRSLDNARAVTPLLAEAEGRRFGLFMHVEKGNVEAADLPCDIEPIFYRPYFTFNEYDQSGVHASLADAVSQIWRGGSIEVDPLLPVSSWRHLSRVSDLTVACPPLDRPVAARRGSRRRLIDTLLRRRAAAQPAALALLRQSPHREALGALMEGSEDRRFEDLDDALADAGLDAVLVRSVLNAQEIGGVPVNARQRPVAVLYRIGCDPWIFESWPGEDSQVYGSCAEALRDLCSTGSVGVEEDEIGIGLWRSFALDQRQTFAADWILRRWRDNNTCPDLPFYVIAGRASASATDEALAFAAETLREGRTLTETDIFARYLRSLRNFVHSVAPDLRLGRTLTNFHSGSRTIFPSNPAPYVLTAACKTFKIDAGCLLLDADGLLLGCSDIARTLCLTDDTADLYRMFKDTIRNDLIPACRAGLRGTDIHARAVEAVWGAGSKFAGNPLVMTLDDPGAVYNRDVGHLLGRNNLAHLVFSRGDESRLRAGMIACCEYQWPISDIAVAYEDTCVVGQEGGLNLISDAEPLIFRRVD